MRTIIITCFIVILLLSTSLANAQETITLTTYYPAPFGIYQQLVTMTLGVGDSNASGGMDANDSPNPNTNPGEVWVNSRLGIATTTPQNQLDVAGAAAIGVGYAGTQAAPANGLAVEGRVGIGTTTPQDSFEVFSQNNPVRIGTVGGQGSITLGGERRTTWPSGSMGEIGYRRNPPHPAWTPVYPQFPIADPGTKCVAAIVRIWSTYRYISGGCSYDRSTGILTIGAFNGDIQCLFICEE
tara:strand:- start:1821 stop:2540 length:720 start_codon:yes stop_codon:yes gene_type:complete